MMDNLLALSCVFTELFLFIMALIIIVYGACDKNMNAKKLKMPMIVVLLCSLFCLSINVQMSDAEVFDGLFFSNQSIIGIKFILIVSTIIFIFIGIDGDAKDGSSLSVFEFPVMILFSLIGMLTLVSANDFISMYLSLELMSLSMYVLAAFSRDNKFSSEAGLKYFILGALSSGMMLYGASLVYGFSGTLNFTTLKDLFAVASDAGVVQVVSGFKIGIVLILVGFLFKLSAAPFHYWTPDVYEGAPLPVTAFFAIVPKLASFVALYNILMGPFASLIEVWSPILLIASACSLIVGSVGGIVQKRLKRLLAYSAINNVGFVLLALATGSSDALATSVTYFVIYMVTLAGVFAFMMKMVSAGKVTDDISALAGLGRTNPWFSFLFSVLLFSLAGIPPLWGFYAKFYIIKLALSSDLLMMSVIVVITSTISAFYYIKIVKVMYFDDFSIKTIAPFEVTTAGSVIASLSALIALFGFLLISTMSFYILQYF